MKPALESRRLVLLAVLAVALLSRAAAFRGQAVTWDGCEYVWAVAQHQLPHGPYVVYLWLGLALSAVFPPDVALAVLSLLCGVLAVAAFFFLVRVTLPEPGGAPAAALLLSVMPAAVLYAASQEVYSTLALLALLACLLAASAGRHAAFAGGVVFGAALATHQGATLFAPVFVYSLVFGAQGDALGRHLRRLTAAGLGTLVVPVAALSWIASLFPAGTSASRAAWVLSVVRGIAPMPAGGAGGRLPLAPIGETLTHVANAAGWRTPVLLLVAAAGLAVIRARPRGLAFWVLWAAPYVLYELALGENLDAGLYVPFVLPAVAAILGGGFAEVWRANAGRAWARTLAVTLGAYLIGASALSSLQDAFRLPTRREFLASPVIATSLWIRDNTPPDTVVVQPPGVLNVNLVPAYAQRRPILFENGVFRLFKGGRWTPLAASSSSDLSFEALRELVAAGTPVVSFVPDPFNLDGGERSADFDRTWREIAIDRSGPGGERIARLWRLGGVATP